MKSAECSTVAVITGRWLAVVQQTDINYKLRWSGNTVRLLRSLYQTSRRRTVASVDFQLRRRRQSTKLSTSSHSRHAISGPCWRHRTLGRLTVITVKNHWQLVISLRLTENFNSFHEQATIQYWEADSRYYNDPRSRSARFCLQQSCACVDKHCGRRGLVGGASSRGQSAGTRLQMTAVTEYQRAPRPSTQVDKNSIKRSLLSLIIPSYVKRR